SVRLRKDLCHKEFLPEPIVTLFRLWPHLLYCETLKYKQLTERNTEFHRVFSVLITTFAAKAGESE
ncbi:hypothetical protein, partial [Candidatus Symbiopectobacterium sp. NZEC135]|uniref:hypothetical protein n=1 Tax=Candidatus Symbiopectobacterium sp. NZEC135 TaxID=2820471 RepID=UPI002226DCF6